ncbi:MAG: transcriptional regulator [Actinomycetia bacterium]|nr:transcriptional regulator [Actinomycetes bacterium]
MSTSAAGGTGTPIRSPAALGRAVRRARRAAGLTQTELAQRARSNRYAIALIEAGHETRAIEQLFDALAALDLELAVRPRRRSGAGERHGA